MITPAKIRAIRAFLNETQEEFASRFKISRYVVIHWEKYGIVNQAVLERQMLSLEGPDHDPHIDGHPLPAPE